MGLAERRVTAEFQDGQFPSLKARIEAAAGCTVPIDVKWDELAVEGEWRLYAQTWPEIYFVPLERALARVARDDMGRAAVAEKLKQIVVRNISGCVYADGCARFADGVLTIDHDPLTNAYDTEGRVKRIVEVLEERL